MAEERTVDEGTKGPKRAKNDIRAFESWLKKHCKEEMPVDEIIERWQYESGHAPPKTWQYLRAIARVGKIKLFVNDGVQYCIWIEGQQAPRLERRYNVETMQTEMMEEEEPPESATEYMQRKKREEINEVRRAMGYADI
jgi:hypothetical protein